MYWWPWDCIYNQTLDFAVCLYLSLGNRQRTWETSLYSETLKEFLDEIKGDAEMKRELKVANMPRRTQMMIFEEIGGKKKENCTAGATL